MSESKPPKKPPTAYVLYSSEYRNRARERYPNASFSDLGRILGEMWKNELTDEERQRYHTICHNAMERWKEEFAKWKASRPKDLRDTPGRTGRADSPRPSSASALPSPAPLPMTPSRTGLGAFGAPHPTAETSLTAASSPKGATLAAFEARYRLVAPDDALRTKTAAKRRREYAAQERFARSLRPRLVKELPHLSHAQLGAELLRRYQALSPAEKLALNSTSS